MLRILCVLLLGMWLSTTYAEPSLWDKTKSATQSAAGTVGDAVEKTGDAIVGEKLTPAQSRAKIDAMAKDSLVKLFKQAKQSKTIFDKSVAYAVFDSRRMSLLITTEFGSGVAVGKKGGKRIYMKMATGGVNIGYGAQLLQFIFMFPTEKTFSDFVENGWNAGADAGAVVGKDAQGLGLELGNGVRVFELNEKGLALSATLTGTKYWQDDSLN